MVNSTRRPCCSAVFLVPPNTGHETFTVESSAREVIRRHPLLVERGDGEPANIIDGVPFLPRPPAVGLDQPRRYAAVFLTPFHNLGS
jgi:hypothetical protein